MVIPIVIPIGIPIGNLIDKLSSLNCITTIMKGQLCRNSKNKQFIEIIEYKNVPIQLEYLLCFLKSLEFVFIGDEDFLTS